MEMDAARENMRERMRGQSGDGPSHWQRIDRHMGNSTHHVTFSFSPIANILSHESAIPATSHAAAGYATLREIEDRLKSIRNIEKITKTMKIVASTKLTRAQRAMNESKTYGKTSSEVFNQAETKALEGEDKKTLLVICSSDKGLCGGIHSGLSRYVRRLFTEKPNAYDLVIIGEKSKSQLSRTQARDIQLSFTGIGKDIPTFADAQAIADQVVSLPNEYAEVKVLYNQFINAQSYEVAEIDAYSVEAIQASRMLSFPGDCGCERSC